VLDPSRVIAAPANLRDLGGVPTLDGRMVRTGRIFRSGYLCDLDGPPRTALDGLGLRTILDLRRTSEIADRPHPELHDCTVEHHIVSSDDNEFAVVANRLADPDGIDGPASVATYFSRSVTHRLDAFRPVFQAATDPARHPLLFNCTAGKDRTGFVGAVLLSLLGVDRETVIADYMLSNEVRRPWLEERQDRHREHLANYLGVDPDDLDDDLLENSRALLWCQVPFIEASLVAIDDGWDSWGDFRRDGLGIDDDRFAEFRDALLV